MREVTEHTESELISICFNLEVVESSKSTENMGRGDHNLSEPQDGADEKMLGSGNGEKSALALKDIEVKFISGDQNTNGDAKIDIGHIDKVSNNNDDEEFLR